MSQENQQNRDKNRKSEAQERFEQADNAGRFAGTDADAQSARAQATEAIRQDTGASREERNKEDAPTDSEARRDPSQSHDFKGEAQNVNTDPETEGRLGGNDSDPEHARNKAMQGIQEQRNDSGSKTGGA